MPQPEKEVRLLTLDEINSDSGRYEFIRYESVYAEFRDAHDESIVAVKRPCSEKGRLLRLARAVDNKGTLEILGEAEEVNWLGR